MPIVWRYLLRNYLQVLFFCVLSFIAVLFVMRFKEIAEFTALNSHPLSVFLFSLYQIPYLLPEAIPISCLITSILLFQRMSNAQELTALRAAGFGVSSLLFPLLCASFVLSLVNFTLVSEVVPRTKSLTKELTYNMMSSNPFYIFHKIAEGKLTNAYVDIHALQGGSQANDVLLIMNNRSNGRLGIMTAKELLIDGPLLKGTHVSIVSSVDSKKKEAFDHLVIENQDMMETKAEHLSQLLKDVNWSLASDYLPLRMLLAKIALQKSFFKNSASLDIARRFSIALTPFLFTFLGSVFGMEIGRQKTKKGILWAALLAAFYLSCFVGAKSMKSTPLIGWIIYFIPYPLILFCTFRSLRKVSRGVE